MDDWHCKGSEKEEKCGATTSRPFRHRNCSDLSCFGLASQKSRSSLRSSRPLAVVATACSVGWRLAAVSGSATAGPFFLLGAHIPPGRGQRGRGLGAESVRTGVRKPTNGTERDGAERTGPVSAGGILLWTGFKNYQMEYELYQEMPSPTWTWREGPLCHTEVFVVESQSTLPAFGCLESHWLRNNRDNARVQAIPAEVVEGFGQPSPDPTCSRALA